MTHRTNQSGLTQQFLEEVLTPDLESDKKGSSARVRWVARLTSITGVTIFALLAIEGLSVPAISQLFTLHVVVGMILLPVMALKIAVTSYRFLLYYLGRSDFVQAGPPWMPLRLIAPLIILSTVVLMLSGVELMLVGPHGASFTLWKPLHQVAFVVWFILMVPHVLAYLMRAVRTSFGDLGRLQSRSYKTSTSSWTRTTLLWVALGVGVGLGLRITAYEPAWLNFFHTFIHGHIR